MRAKWTCVVAGLVVASALGLAQSASRAHPSFEVELGRMDVDVDGAPRAYGPKGSNALDDLKHAHLEGHFWKPIVGYLMDDETHKPVVQGPHDPAPGFYVSQTAYTDKSKTNECDVSRYVDASKINYIVLGDKAKKGGAVLGDFVTVYSKRTHKTAFAIAADDGNPSGNEGSLHLLQELGYPFHDGKDDAVEAKGEIVVRYYPGSNPGQMFFRTQRALDAAAVKVGLSRNFVGMSASK